MRLVYAELMFIVLLNMYTNKILGYLILPLLVYLFSVLFQLTKWNLRSLQFIVANLGKLPIERLPNF